MPNMSLVHLPQLYIVSPTGKKARHPWCRDSGVSKGHLLRLWLKPFRIQFFLDFPSYATPVTLPPPVLYSSATLILHRICLLPLFGKQWSLTVMYPFPLRWYSCCSFMLPRQPAGHVPHLPQFIIVRLLRKARLLFFQFGLSIMYYTVANLNLFRWISGEVKSYFLGAKLWNSFHFFPKVSVDDSQIPALPIYAGIFLFLILTKRVFRDKLSAAILSNKKYKNLPFSAGTKRVFVHFFMVTTESVPYWSTVKMIN